MRDKREKIVFIRAAKDNVTKGRLLCWEEQRTIETT